MPDSLDAADVGDVALPVGEEHIRGSSLAVAEESLEDLLVVGNFARQSVFRS